jgi:Pyruvate/2-oxoacid:ferredoxin oxidoreductase delta subunit
MKGNSTHNNNTPTTTEEECFCYCDTTKKEEARDDDEWLECGGCNGCFICVAPGSVLKRKKEPVAV